ASASLFINRPMNHLLLDHIRLLRVLALVFFYFHPAATTETYSLSLHDALPICQPARLIRRRLQLPPCCIATLDNAPNDARVAMRSEEHTSELQSRFDLVCRLLLEKKKIH